MLETFLSFLLKQKVEIQEYLTNELQEENIYNRRKTVDLFVKTNRQYLVLELNNGTKEYTNFRNFIYFTSIINQKTKSGEVYNSNIKYMLINLTYGLKEDFVVDNFTLCSEQKKKIHR